MIVADILFGLNFDRWDEWVGIDRLMNINNENLQKQKALENELKPKNPNS